MHILARKHYQRLALPEILTIRQASGHDLPVLQEFLGKTGGVIFADKAYQDLSLIHISEPTRPY